MSNRRKAEGKTVEVGLLVEKPDALTHACARAIEKALQQKSLKFDKQPGYGEKMLFTLVGPGATNAREKYTYKVLPLNNIGSGSEKYWLAASLEFFSEPKKFRMVSASLFIFRGEPNDNKKVALLRAEWACMPNDILGKHAQPHWHIYPSQLQQYKQETFVYNAEIETQEFIPEAITLAIPEGGSAEQSFNDQDSSPQAEGWKMSEVFHFAMSSRWQDDVTLHNESLSEKCLPMWLEGCTRYTLEQLSYMYQKKKIVS